MRVKKKSYSELILLPNFKERFEYLKLDGKVGHETFGYDRWLNQQFYKSSKWKSLRDKIIIRDNGCDLALEGYTIPTRIYVHHINPVTASQLSYCDDNCLDPENLICVSFDTHQAIHYGYECPTMGMIVRRPGDTNLIS